MGDLRSPLFILICWTVFVPSYQECPTLVTDFSQATCISRSMENTTYYYQMDVDACFPGCEEYNPDGHTGETCPCPPAYYCDKRCRGTQDDILIKCNVNTDCGTSRRARCVATCVPYTTQTCMAYHANTIDFESTYYTAKFKPICDNDGNWEAKQCKGGVNGRCFCFDKGGTRIFGQALYKDADDMTCACSRKRADLEASGRNFVSFHCDQKGNFEPLQCDSGLCWCADPKTGELNSTIVPEKAMDKLPCYQLSNVGSQYLRQCDSIKYSIGKLSDILGLRGVTKAYPNPVVCDGDGAYGAYNITGGIAQCLWRDGKRLGSWQTQSDTDLRTVTCNCARDSKIYGENLACSGSGDYNPVQYVIKDQQALYYCVDSDGFIKSKMFEHRPENCTIYY